MKELRELIRDLQEDVTMCDVNDVTCDIQKLNSQNHKELDRYLQYLKSVEEYEASRKQSKE